MDAFAVKSEAIRQPFLTGEIPDGAGCKARVISGIGIVLIQYRNAGIVLVSEDVCFRGRIFVHVLMPVQMVRRQIRHDGNIRRAVHLEKLEGGEFDNRVIPRGHPVAQRKQIPPDVAADENGFLSASAFAGYDGMQITVVGNDGRILLVSRFDNLGKGASGAAIQNMNIVLGREETAGLYLKGC